MLDPSDDTRNLTPAITKAKMKYTTGVFNYCFHVVSEFCGEQDLQKRRAQSALSTIVGGEPFWPRVVHMYQRRIEPYSVFVCTNWQKICSEVARQTR